MTGLLNYLFGAASFVPHGYCLLWRPDLVALHALADALTALAYFSIPSAILVFQRRRSDLQFPWLAMLFAAFILGCGLTHVADLVTLWWPIYGLEGLLKAVTAVISVITAIVVWPLLPHALALPTPGQLQRQNQALSAEIVRRGEAEAALGRVLDELERRVTERTRELVEANRLLEIEVGERRRAEATACASEARLQSFADRLRLAVEATGLGIWDVDLDTGARRWTDEFKTILGVPQDVPPDEALFASLIHPDDQDWVNDRYGHFYQADGGGRYHAEFRIRRAGDGAERWVEATGMMLLDENGRPTRGIGTLADITERRRAIDAVKESEERYRALVETAPDAVYAHEGGRIVLVNDRATTLFGARHPDELIGRSVFSLVDSDSLELARTRTATLTIPGARAELAELIYRRLDGTPFAVEAAAAAVLVEGQLVVQVVFRDITVRKQAEQALQARTAELETMMETVPVAVWLAHDVEARRITGNRQAATMFRLISAENHSLSAPTEQRPSHFSIVRDGNKVPVEQLPVQRAARGELVRNEELRVVFEDGSFFDELVSATPIRDAAGTIAGAVGVAVDITERKAAEERMRHMALHDALTGLPNRTLFYDRLAQAMALAHRRGERVSVMLLDLDQFKEINDTLGHSAGDALLREVAKRLRRVVRASDTWARLGGDEFALVQAGLEEMDDAIQMAGRVLASLREPFRINRHELDVGASLGLTLFPDDGETAEVLLRNADVALYRAKSNGRGRFEPYHLELDRDLRQRCRVQRGLRHALEQNRLALVYQPIFELGEQRLARVEALARWRRRNGEFISPATFIPIAEASGLIHSLGGWVLRTACQQAVAWRRAGRPVKMAVNVSAAQLRQPEFACLVEEALRNAGLEPGLLELELTESVFLDPSKEQIHETLQRLAALGVTLAIDDFGTGYSSLAYLKHFPFDEVKLDRLFTADIGQGNGAGAFVAAVVTLAHSLGKRVTAEGVETPEQLDFLREQGCDAAQGFLLARPGPAEGVVRLLATAA